MTMSIFDPTGSETEHSGSRNLGPDAIAISHMPPDIVDGVVDCDEEEETVDMDPFDPPAVSRAEPPAASKVASAAALRAKSTDADAPQEPDAIDEPSTMMEGQLTDESDAPQDAPE